jgi:hypothetical protein
MKNTKNNCCIIGTLILTMLIIWSGCKPQNIDKYDLRTIEPPNGVRIVPSLFCDETEITNHNWREYIYWLGNHYGFESEEYLASLPDTNVWKKEIYSLHHLSENYLRNPIYDDFPVVGISQKQAEDYSMWRSTVVFYMFLIEQKEFSYTNDKTFRRNFSIEAYFNNRIEGIRTNPKIRYYPRYRLPTPEERLMILQYADSVNTTGLQKCTSSYCRECLKQYPKINCGWPDSDFRNYFPLLNVRDDCVPKKAKPLYHVRGNVNEWLSIPSRAAGGSWRNTKADILENDIINMSSPDAYTGFRNVCEWVEWDGKFR